MTILQVSAALLSFTSLLFIFNQLFLKLPNSVGLMFLSLCTAGLLAVLQYLGFTFVGEFADSVLSSIDLNEAVINGFLCLLLFVGAIHVDVKSLIKERYVIGTLATGGVLISTVVTGVLSYGVFWILGLHVPFAFCLVFGALISSTDAVTVLLFLKKVNLAPSLESKITGESLLNDGMSIVLFSSILALALNQEEINLLSLPLVVIWDIFGAVGIGSLLGVVAHAGIHYSPKDNPYISIMVTLALATTSYSVADAFGVSGPIAVVVAGLVISNVTHTFSRSRESSQQLVLFWDLLDEILNSILFVIIGLELLSISTVTSHLVAAIILIPLALMARYVSIFGTIACFPRLHKLHPKITNILTWGGLRGGISIALVLSLPAGEIRDILMTATYAVVVFSVFVQGPTLARIVKRNAFSH